MNKKKLYESIMTKISKIVKESIEDMDSKYIIWYSCINEDLPEEDYETQAEGWQEGDVYNTFRGAWQDAKMLCKEYALETYTDSYIDEFGTADDDNTMFSWMKDEYGYEENIQTKTITFGREGEIPVMTFEIREA